MNKRIKALSLILALTVLIFSFSVTAFATDGMTGDSDVGDVGGTGDSGADTGDVGGDTDTGNDQYTPDYSDPGNIDQDVTGDDNNNYNDTDYNDTSSSGGGYVDSYTNEDGYYYYDEDKMAQSVEDTAGSVSDYTSLYNTKIDDKELESAQWNAITLSVKDSKDDAGDFSAIKDNKQTEDNGEWILYLGIALIGLALLGILYFVVATVTYKKKLKALRARDQRQKQYHNDSKRDNAIDIDYYGDNIRVARTQKRRYASDDMSYSERKSRKSDTMELYTPKRYAKK